MKENKFHAWDKVNKKMTTDFLITSEGTVFQSHYDKDLYITYDYEIMQFTGMKDKNGKDIFEGDFVVIPEGYGGDRRYHQTVGIVTYENAEFYPHNINERDGIVMQDWHWHNMEVIGNIYEDKEKIQGENK